MHFNSLPLDMNSNELAESFGTLSETVNGLKKAGYTLDFNVHQDCIICQQTKTVMSPEDFQIDKAYRFEGPSDPNDESIVYAISSEKLGVKGVLVNGYGISADEASARLIERLEIYH
jgi:hypothetical protein